LVGTATTQYSLSGTISAALTWTVPHALAACTYGWSISDPVASMYLLMQPQSFERTWSDTNSEPVKHVLGVTPRDRVPGTGATALQVNGQS
jgi:hypothetical protein